MMMQNAPPSRFVLPLPSFVLHPYTAVIIAIVHIYLSVGHLSNLFAGDVQWTHFWKGFGALAGAYVFAALSSRGFRPVGWRMSGGQVPSRGLDLGCVSPQSRTSQFTVETPTPH